MRADFQSAMDTWEREYLTTLEVFAAIPEGRNDQTIVPGKGWMLGELAWHICISERWFCAEIMGAKPVGENPVPSDRQPPTIADMIDELDADETRRLLESYELCPIHRCDDAICADDANPECAHLR